MPAARAAKSGGKIGHKVGRKPPTVSGPQSVKIGLDVTEETPTFYANHLEVGHSNFEFMLNVARFPAKPSAAQMRRVAEQGAFILEPEIQILFPPKVAVALVDALQLQIASYEAHIGKITP